MADTPPKAPIVVPEPAAGGGEASVEPQMKDLDTVGDSLLPYFKSIATGPRAFSTGQSGELKKPDGSIHGEGTGAKADLKSLLDYFASPVANAMAPLPANDLTHALSDYFISSSHNTYLTGNQLYGDASTAAYKDVLIRGCRCIEIDVWDGEEKSSDSSDSSSANEGAPKHKSGLKARVRDAINRRTGSLAKRGGGKPADVESHPVAPQPWNPSGSLPAEPRVLHGHTLTKDVSFRAVCMAIRESAFVHSDLPIIVSLEIHAGPAQQELIVQIMRQTWTDMLLSAPNEDPQKLPSPSELKRKILIKVKAAPKPALAAAEGPPAAAAAVATAAAGAASDSESSDARPSSSGKKAAKAKKSKVIPALSAMGIYTCSYHFSKLDSSESAIPTHVFSLSENKLMQVHESFGPSLFAHNRKFLMRAYPAGTRVSSSNLDPSIFWRKFGVQMVALNWQRIDAGVMLNEGEFAGSGGWILKPPAYRSTESPEITEATAPTPGSDVSKAFDLQIEIMAAQDLPPRDESKVDRIHPYVLCQLHAGSNLGRPKVGEGGNASNEDDKLKRRTKPSKGSSPDFGGELLQFKNISTVEELSFLRFKVKNDGRGRDSLVAWACVRLDRLRLGYRLVHLLDSKGRESRAVLLVNIVKSGT